MHIQSIFWQILGMGIAIPFSFITLLTICMKILAKKDFQIDVIKVLLCYTIAVLGWSIAYGIK